jgi:hypothetical protein
MSMSYRAYHFVPLFMPFSASWTVGFQAFYKIAKYSVYCTLEKQLNPNKINTSALFNEF